jgi:hypothetical protein
MSIDATKTEAEDRGWKIEDSENRSSLNQFKQRPSRCRSSTEGWNPGYMDVSGGVLAKLDAGHPCRHDGDLYFCVLRARCIVQGTTESESMI